MHAAVTKDLLLLGGGHSHIAVLRAFAMRPLPGLRISLISRVVETPYSGMLPGVIAGRYSVEQAHIDLNVLCRFAGARFIEAEAVGFDPQEKCVELAGRPPLAYDLLSINCGSTPTPLPPLAAGGDSAVPVKPIDRFLERWRDLLERLQRRGGGRIAVVGGGAGGVELCLAIEYRLRGLGLDAELELLTADADILPAHAPGVRRRLRRIMRERGITLATGARVVAASSSAVALQSGEQRAYDEVLSVTNAAAPAWIAASGIATDAEGFVAVDAHLRSTSHPDVFAAGDAAAMRAAPRPKSGVFAVRQGMPLAGNLRRALLGRGLRRYTPQRRFLSLISTGDGAAVASRGAWSAEGPWVWRWKDWIDRRFMARYQDLPRMPAAGEMRAAKGLPEYRPEGAPDDGMRCGGCGAKLGADVLSRALRRIETVARDDVVIGLHDADDAAVLEPPAGRLQVLSVDAFRPMLGDPYLFGRIAANHCLNDLYALGAEPQSAMAVVTLPVWPAAKLVEELAQMLAGATGVLDAAGAALVGGHSGEGEELSLGFSVTGLVERNAMLPKTGLRDGDCLVLTKPLGTGALFAADMRAGAKGRWIHAAVDVMQQSNRAAARILRGHGASACTDVTGFGLFGHLSEMQRGRPSSIKLWLDALPALDGTVAVLRRGFRSSMQAANERLAAGFELAPELRRHDKWPLLFDPQTAGGLVAGVPPAAVAACLEALRAAGYAAAAIGRVGATPAGDAPRFELIA